MELVRGVVTHPSIWPYVSDDGSGEAKDYRPIDHDSVWHISAYDGASFLGVWTITQENAVTWDIHTCLLPSSWGAIAREAGREVIQWIWTNTTCRRLVTKVPAFNRLALRFAKMAGFVEYGCNPNSFLKDGVLHDQILLGISKPEGECL